MTMVDDELQQQLKRWGNATAARFAANDDGHSIGDHVLARNRDLAPGTRENAERRLIGRDGEERRRYMAAIACRDRCTGCGAHIEAAAKACPACGASKPRVRLRLSVVPVWAVDPVRCKNDADAPHDRTPAARVDLGIPDELRWVDRAITQMSREHPIRALVLREEFCGTGTQRMKAGRVERQYGGTLSVRQYRYELQRALDWMRGKRAA